MFLILATLLLQAPQELVSPQKFAQILDKGERAGMAVPDLADAVKELQALAKSPGGDKIPQESLDRLLVLRARNALFAPFHARLLQAKGGTFELPIMGGKVEQVRIDQLKKKSVVVLYMGGSMEIAYDEIDREWLAGRVRDEVLKSQPDAVVLLAVALADAGKWDAATRELGKTVHPHRLVVEIRARIKEAFLARAEKARKDRKFDEALDTLKAGAETHPDDADAKSLRDAMFKELVDQGKSQARQQQLKEMEATLATLAKHYTESGDAIKAIRAAARWILVANPADLGLEGKKGEPILLKSDEDKSRYMQVKLPKGEFDAISIRVRFAEGSQSGGGLCWENYQRLAWLSRGGESFGVAHGGAAKAFEPDVNLKGDDGTSHLIGVFIQNGEYVVMYNDRDVFRVKTGRSRLENLSLTAHDGKVWFDEIWLRKKQ
jgi:tetratricopeptide (TPR) repeat protein